MNKVFTWVVRIIVLVVLVKVVMWSWEQYQAGGMRAGRTDVPEWDQDCKITNPDLGSCVCVHRDTKERLDMTYDECVTRARRQR